VKTNGFYLSTPNLQLIVSFFVVFLYIFAKHVDKTGVFSKYLFGDEFMKKKVTVAVAIIAVIVSVTIGFSISANSHTGNQLKSALSEKYGWEKNDIKIVSYQKGYWDYNIGFMDDSIYFNIINPKWEIKYKDRVFNAEYFHFHFADDYQLEDIFQWCTDYLQENVDPEIAGIEVPSDIIYHSPEYNYDYKLPWNYKKVFTKSDSKEIIEQISTNSNLLIFYKVDNLQDFGIVKTEQRKYYVPNNNFIAFSKDKDKILKESLKNYQLVLIDINRFERCQFELLSGSNISCISFIGNNELSYIKGD